MNNLFGMMKIFTVQVIEKIGTLIWIIFSLLVQTKNLEHNTRSYNHGYMC